MGSPIHAERQAHVEELYCIVTEEGIKNKEENEPKQKS